MTKKVDWNIFSVNISGSLKYTALIAKFTYGSFERDSGHPVLSCLELKKGNNWSEVIPSPKQFALIVSMCCRKHWSSWNMLINLLLTHLKCVSIIPNCTLKNPVSSRLVSRNINFCFSFLSPSHPNLNPTVCQYKLWCKCQAHKDPRHTWRHQLPVVGSVWSTQAIKYLSGCAGSNH